MSCHDDMTLEDLQPSVKTEVDQVKDNSLEMTAVGHNGIILITSQKTRELMETDTVLIIYAKVSSKYVIYFLIIYLF